MHYGYPHQHTIASLWMYPQPCLLKWADQKSRTGLPMVDLMCRDLTFCQFFFNKETRKLMAGGGFGTSNRWKKTRY